MEKICPKNGSLCPVQIVLETTVSLALTDKEASMIEDPVYGIAGAVRRQAGEGSCEGAAVDENEHFTIITCGNSNNEAMKRVYDMQKDARGLSLSLPERILSVTRGNSQR